MPEYLSPGVYVEEVSTGPRPIEGVSTSTAGFVGQTERGPEYPVLVTSWLEYQRTFGSYLGPDITYLAYAVQGFFDNGGKRAFIARVTPGVAGGNNITAPKRALAALGDLTLSANGRGAWGNRVYVAIEKASKAKAVQPGDPSPVGKWLKVTLLYFTKEPSSKAFKVFDSALQANDLATQSGALATTLGTAGITAKAAVDLFETDTTNAANKTAAVQAVQALKAAADALVAPVTQLLSAAKTAQEQSAAALNAFPTDAKLKAAKDSADTAATAAATAKASADQAVKDADAAAKDDPPTSAKTDAAKTSSAKAKTDMDAAVTAAGDVSTKAAAAYPMLLVDKRAAETSAALDAALAAANAAKPALVALAGNQADPGLLAAAKTAVGDVKKATDKAGAGATALQSAAGQAKTTADAGADQALKTAAAAAKTAADTLKTSVDAVVTASNTSATTDPPTSALNDATVAAITAAQANVAPATTAAANVVAADKATKPTLLAVNPMIPENQRDPNFRAPDHVEVYDNLRPLAGATNSLELALNSSSQLVVADVAGPNIPLSVIETGPGGKPQVVFTALAGGAPGKDGVNDLTLPRLDDFNGLEDPIDNTNPDFGTGSGLAGLGMIEGISLLAAPDEVSVGGLSEEVIKQCELLRDRFGIVSAPFGKSNINDVRPTQDTTYAAFYYPWISVYDPLSNGQIWVPPTGHVTGLIARVDIDRGVHKAPANEVLRDATDLEFPIPKGKQDLLNPIGVNCMRDFRPQGRSIRLWGARTMTSDPEWKYINVRRLFIFIEQSILRGTQWVVFEPNNDALWASVILSITNFLIGVWKSGALLGRTQEEAFFVRCDRTTMTQDDLDNGRLVCLIGIAPTKPAEFVIFRISQKVADAPQ